MELLVFIPLPFRVCLEGSVAYGLNGLDRRCVFFFQRDVTRMTVETILGNGEPMVNKPLIRPAISGGDTFGVVG